ncbi:MAG TPA: amino acid adenylation domain-containing protein [Thermoanaerobaculia bacterium]|nr:amino acid adenylation domain-containing protein [Thermoanaerobaculia bacterium]
MTEPLTDLQLSYLVGRESPVLGGTGCWLCWELENPRWDVGKLEDACNALVARHEALRTVFAAGGTKRVLEEFPRFAIEHVDLRHESDEAAAAGLADLRERMLHARTDPARWPLFRVAAASMPSGMRLFLGFDMLIVDASSIFLLLRELGELYADPARARAPLPVLPPGAEERKSSEAYRASSAYWTSRLDDLPPAPELPASGAAREQSRFFRYEHRLDEAAWNAFQERAAARGLRRVPAIIAAFSEVLARWAARRDFTLNLTAGKLRPEAAAEGILGEFSSNLLLTVDCRTEAPFAERARAIGAQLARDLEHVAVSGVEVISALSRRRNERVLMPVVFTSLIHRHASFEPFGRFVSGITRTPQVTLDCQILEDGHGLYLSWDVVEGFYPEELPAAMFGSWTSLVERLAESDAAWDEQRHDLLPAPQRARRAEANATAVAWPQETLHARVLEQARSTPERVAVITGEGTLTYRDVASRAAALAQALRDANVQRNELVAVVLPKGWQQVVAVLGVQMAGAAYLPVDTGAPPARIAELLRLGECRVAIAGEGVELPANVRPISPIGPIGPMEPSWDAGPATPDDLAYVIFTSGSTGVPKGVMIRHSAAANTVRDINERFALTADDRVLALSALNFDLSVWDIFGLLSCGAAIVIPDAESLRDPAYLAGLVEEQGVTIWNSVPSYLQMLAEHGPDPRRLRSLRLAMLSGDWIPVSLPGRLPVPIVSLGGATEASIWSIAYPVGAVDSSWKSIPYGKPLANQQFHVLDERLEDCPDGIAGELYIGGIGLADGYWRDERQTNASFIHHPRTGERLYRTGDWGRFLPDGNIEFLGRRDGQVKISGHRVELGEVEAALIRCDGVTAAAAVTFADDHAQKRLAAFYTGGASPQEVRRRLQAALPAYMVPLRLTPLDALPLSTNGKIDRKVLSERAAAPQRAAQPLERLFASAGVLQESEARRTFVAAGRGVRNDFNGNPRVLLHPDGELPFRAAQWTSVREFSGTAALRQLEALLNGLRAFESEGRVRRAYPTAGDTCSVQTYVHVRPSRVTGLDGGVYYYHPLRHELVAVAPAEAVDAGIHVPANQRMAAEAAFTIFFFADLDAIRPLYGDLAEPFAWIEAGHMAQILRQSAAEHGLGLCLIGAFDAAPVRTALGLGEQYLPLASMAGGVPRPKTAVMAPRLDVAEHRTTSNTASLELANAIAAIWRDVLELPTVGHDERFFEVGGTSFSILGVQRELAARLGKEVSITELFRHATIAELAAHLAGSPAGSPSAALAQPQPQMPPQALHLAGDDGFAEKRQLRRALRRMQSEEPPR